MKKLPIILSSVLLLLCSTAFADSYLRVYHVNTMDFPFSASLPSMVIHFTKNSAALDSRDEAVLANFAHHLPVNKHVVLHVDGFTSSTGAEQFNKRLSVQRASVVKNFLAANGLLAENVTVTGEGKGNDAPVASNHSADGRALNRRTEIVEVVANDSGWPIY